MPLSTIELGQIIYQSETCTTTYLYYLRLGDQQSKEADGVIPYIAELVCQIKQRLAISRISALEQERILSLIHDYQERGSIHSRIINLTRIYNRPHH